MAAGKPIVAVRAAAVPEVVRNGILVEPENPEALADGIARLYRDPMPLQFARCRPAARTSSNSMFIALQDCFYRRSPRLRRKCRLGVEYAELHWITKDAEAHEWQIVCNNQQDRISDLAWIYRKA